MLSTALLQDASTLRTDISDLLSYSSVAAEDNHEQLRATIFEVQEAPDKDLKNRNFNFRAPRSEYRNNI